MAHLLALTRAHYEAHNDVSGRYKTVSARLALSGTGEYVLGRFVRSENKVVFNGKIGEVFVFSKA